MSPRRAGDLSPLLLVVIDALETQDSRERHREAAALRAFAELARVEIPARGVFAPRESELCEAIEAIATRHLGFRGPMKALRAKLATVEPFERRDAIASAATRVRTVSDAANFSAGFAFGVTFADIASSR
jgi:hypothetical protein